MMNDKMEKFKMKVEQSESIHLVDSLIEHAKKADESLDYYEATKIIKHELLERLNVSR